MISFENMFISTTLTKLRKIPAKVSTLNISLHQQHFQLDESNKVKQKHSSAQLCSAHIQQVAVLDRLTRGFKYGLKPLMLKNNRNPGESLLVSFESRTNKLF